MAWQLWQDFDSPPKDKPKVKVERADGSTLWASVEAARGWIGDDLVVGANPSRFHQLSSAKSVPRLPPPSEPESFIEEKTDRLTQQMMAREGKPGAFTLETKNGATLTISKATAACRQANPRH